MINYRPFQGGTGSLLLDLMSVSVLFRLMYEQVIVWFRKLSCHLWGKSCLVCRPYDIVLFVLCLFAFLVFSVLVLRAGFKF